MFEMEGQRCEGDSHGSLVVSLPAPETARIPDHAVRLPGGQWQLWRMAILRGAGFPARLILTLASEQAAAAADRYLVAIDEVQRCRASAIAALARSAATADPESRRRIWKLQRKIRQEVVPPDATGSTSARCRMLS